MNVRSESVVPEHARNGTVTIYVASANTAPATELCICSLRLHTPRDMYRLHVCDGGSEDGSLSMLERMLHSGVIDELTVEPRGRSHGDWLDWWTATCPSRFGLALDSDVEILRSGWLELLTETALSRQASLVFAELIPEMPGYVDHTGVARRLARRPSPWMMLFEPRTCATLGSWKFTMEQDEGIPEGAWGFDTGAALLRAADRQGLVAVEAPARLRSMFRHYGGLSWVKTLQSKPGWRLKAKALKIRVLEGYVRWRLTRIRRRAAHPS
jgi:hypothetical protein